MKDILQPKEMVFTEAMFATGKPARQGEVYIWMKKHAPASVLKSLENGKFKPLKHEGGALILGHSETGHHHVLEPLSKSTSISKAATVLILETNDLIADMKLNEECRLAHKRGNDTHATQIFPAGEYVRVLRQEQTVEGWRKVRD